MSAPLQHCRERQRHLARQGSVWSWDPMRAALTPSSGNPIPPTPLPQSQPTHIPPAVPDSPTSLPELPTHRRSPRTYRNPNPTSTSKRSAAAQDWDACFGPRTRANRANAVAASCGTLLRKELSLPSSLTPSAAGEAACARAANSTRAAGHVRQPRHVCKRKSCAVNTRCKRGGSRSLAVRCIGRLCVQQ